MNSLQSIPRAYSPKEYGFIGFLFGLIPLFFMSWSNSKILTNGEEVRKRTKSFFVVWCVLMIGYLSVLTWAAFSVTAGIKNYIQQNSGTTAGIVRLVQMEQSPEYALDQVPEAAAARGVITNAGTILFVLQIILLIAFVYSSNRVELPVFKHMKESGAIGARAPGIPVLLGIGTSIVLYNSMSWYIEVMMRVFAK